MYQMYLQFLKDVEIQLRKKVEESAELVCEHLLNETYKGEDIPLVKKKLEIFKFHVQKYQSQALENFKANIKANVEGPVQSQTHYLSMKNQRQRSKQFAPDDLESVIDTKIQASLEKQQQQLIQYLETFEEEFKNQNSSLLAQYQQIEEKLGSINFNE